MTEYKPEEIVSERFTPFKLMARNYLDRFKPAKLEAAKKSFAAEMAEDEKPLYMYDNSFVQNGSSGMLVTDRKVYGSQLAAPIPLACVYSVGALGQSRGVDQGGIVVNGVVACTADSILGCYTLALEQLATHARECGVDWPLSADEQSALDEVQSPEVIQQVYEHYSTGEQSADRLKTTLESAGLRDPGQRLLMTGFPNLLKKHRPGYFVLRMVAGLGGALLFGALAAVGFMNEAPGAPFLLMFATAFLIAGANGYLGIKRSSRNISLDEATQRWTGHCQTIQALLQDA